MSSYEEQYRKKEYLSAQTPWRVLILTLVIFIFSVLIYFGMIFGYKPYLKSQTRNLEQKISVLNQSIDETQQKQIVTFFSQMVNIQSLLSGHKYFSSIFDFIEKNTHQKITYSDLKFNVSEMDIKIEGTAPSYDLLVNQLAVYNQAPEVKKVSLDSSSAQEGSNEVRFSVRLILDQSIFKQPINQQINESTSTPQQ